MLYPLIKATHYIGLAALLGGPAFWYLIWRPARHESGEEAVLPSDRLFAFLVRAVMAVGFLLFAASGVLDIVRSTVEFYGFGDWEFVRYVARETHAGRVIVARIGLALAFFVVGCRLPLRRRSFGWLAPLAAGLVIIATISALSHQAGKESPFPLIFDMIHLAATALWGGGLIYFSLLPWSVMQRETSGARRLASAANLFSVMGLLCVTALTITGVYISLQQFHSIAAVTGTTYGAALLRKLAAFGGILAIAAVQHFYFVPAVIGASGEKTVRLGSRFLSLVRVETAFLIAVLIAAGFLTTQMPPQRPVGLLEIPHATGEFEDFRYELTILPRDQGQLLFELLVHDAAGNPVELTDARLDLTMLEHYMPPYVLRMEPAGPGIYRATGILSMGGRWHATLEIVWPGNKRQVLPIAFDTRASVLDAAQEKKYAWKAVLQKPLGLFWFVLFALLGALGLVALVRGLRLPRQVLLIVLGALLLTGSSFQLARVAEVPGPYSYRRNPVRRTPEVIARGADLYRTHCLVCHGAEGRGDGPAARSLNPPPVNFTTPPGFQGAGLRAHTDGELYWAITKGIRGSSMPAYEDILTDEDRWILVWYVRHLSGEP